MAANKTQKTTVDPQTFLDGVENEKRREDAGEVMALMAEVTGEKPVMWGPSIIGFGNYHYRYETGREGDWFLTGFSPRKDSLSLYIMSGFRRYDELMQKLGKFKTGKACLYVRKLEDVDRDVLRQLIEESVAYMRENYPEG